MPRRRLRTGIRSIQQWAYETFKDSRAIKFVVMATPEDVTANVEYIKVADECVEVHHPFTLPFICLLFRC